MHKLLRSGDTWNDENSTGQGTNAERQSRSTNNQNIVYQMWEGGIRDLNEIEAESGYTIPYIRILLKNRGFSVGSANARPESEINDICEAYVAEEPVSSILVRFKIANNTFYKILRERGVPIRNTAEGRAPRKAFMDTAVDMYTQGIGVKDIYIETGISTSALYQELAVRNIPLRRKTGIPDPTIDNAVEMYVGKQHLADINASTGVNPSRLYQELAIRGIPLRVKPDHTERLERAIELYQSGATGQAITRETSIGSAVLYQALEARGIGKRNKQHRILDAEKVLGMYDEGVSAPAIMKSCGVSVGDIISLLQKRGGSLRTGLSMHVSNANYNVAVEAYQQNVDYDTIEIDTFVNRVQLLSVLKRRKIEIRP